MKKASPALAGGLLLLGVFFWGVTFPVVKEAMRTLDVFSFLAFRFFAAGVLLFAMYYQKIIKCSKATIIKGIGIGALLALSFAAQTLGIKYTTVSNAAFITGLYIIVVPAVVAILDKRAPGGAQTLSVIMALAGLTILTFTLPFSLNAGDWWTLLCAFTFGLHVVSMGRMMGDVDAEAFSAIQAMTVAILCGVAGVFSTGGLNLAAGVASWKAILFCAVLGSAYTFTVQARYQRSISEISAAVIFSAEPLFAAIVANFYPGINEPLTARTLVGGLLICAAMAVSGAKTAKTRK